MEPGYSLPLSTQPATCLYPWTRSVQSMPPSHFLKIHFNNIYLSLGLPSGLFPSGFPTKFLYEHLLNPICATCPAHLVPLDLISRVIVSEEYESQSSSLSSFLQPPGQRIVWLHVSLNKLVLFVVFRCEVGGEASILEQQIKPLMWNSGQLYIAELKNASLFFRSFQGMVPESNLTFNKIKSLLLYIYIYIYIYVK